VVKSPCIDICELDDHDICIGCYRSLDEISRWSAASEPQQRAILQASEKRREVSGNNSATDTDTNSNSTLESVNSKESLELGSLEFTDQMGRVLRLKSRPVRIVSLVPSQTELLFDLGLDAEVVGITKFCTDPVDKVKTVQKVGGTKKFDFDAIAKLEPDLIIGNKEENYQGGVEKLKQYYPVWMSDITTLEDSLEMIKLIGDLVDKSSEAQAMVEEISNGMKDLGEPLPLKVAYLIWQNPYMVAGSDTFIDEMLKQCGFENVFADEERYPTATLVKLQDIQADVVMLSTEPYPFKESHIQSLQEELPHSKVVLVDAMYFSWYGSRLLGTAKYLRSLKRILS